ncbi:MAG: PDZ domain-containing protein [Hyphomicrobium sp.]|uniref:PDZ domain-containing protein n=1 Tax=Hyphomicrobium sp. TaxID=82 RepID=UPI003D0D6F1E
MRSFVLRMPAAVLPCALLVLAPLAAGRALAWSVPDRGADLKSLVVPVADDDDRDIIRLLPPGTSSSPPQQPDIRIPNGGGAVPGQGLRLSGQTIAVPINFQPWPGRENLSYVGLRLDGVNDPALAAALGLDKEAGVFVVDTTPGAPAAQAGLRFGDFVTALDGKPVTQTSDFVEAVKQRAPGSQGTLTVWRVGDDGTGYLEALRTLADRGSTPAMMFLARLYTNGTGVQRDASQAVSWFKKAALAGSTNGMLLYGDALATGQGTVKDVAEGQRWIRKSAQENNVAALYRLGRMFRDGEGMAPDAIEAVNLFKKAAEQNYSPAMVAVGLMFEGGGGLEADHLQAAQWYKRAAEAGDADGMAALGTMYSTGRGVEKNPTMASMWYTEAAKQGQLLAIHNLAYHYDKGIGVARDPNTASALVYQALERHYQFTYEQMVENSRAWSREFRKALQLRLAAGGYYTGAADGSFGRTTFDAIKTMVQTQ